MTIGSSVQPYSAPRARSLPTLTNQDPATVFANWNAQLADNVRNVAPQATPQNFTVTNAGGALTLNWGTVPNASGADGYEILKSQSGTFTTDLQVIPVKNVNQTSYVDNLGGNIKCSYRIRTTSGTIQNPQSQRGPESGVVTHTSLAVGSTAASTTRLDTFTTDKSRALARNGNYGAFKIPGTVKPARGQGSAASGVVSGPAGGSSSGAKSIASSPTSNSGGGSSGGGSTSVSSVPFSAITSGLNLNATMVVGAGASLTPNASNPGVIQATTAPWSGLFGDLTAAQFIYFDNTSTVGTPASSISQVSNGVIGIGSTTATNGALMLATATVTSTLNAINIVTTTLVAAAATVSGLAINGEVVENGVRTQGAGLVPIVYAIKSTTATGSQAQSTLLPVGGLYEAIGFFGHITNTTLTLGNATVSWYDGGSGALMVASPQLLLVSSGAVVTTLGTTNTTGTGTAYFTPIAFNATATTFAWGVVCNTTVGAYEFGLVVKQLF